MRPPPSIYASYNTSALSAQLQRMQKSNDATRDGHADKMRKLKETLATKVWPTEDADEDYADEEPWARKPASGSIIGVGLVRASTPEDLREQIYPPPEPKSKEATVGEGADVSMQMDGTAAEIRGEDGLTDEERRKKEAEMIDEINKESGENIPSAIPPPEEQQTLAEKAAFAPAPPSAPLQAPDAALPPAANDADMAAVAEAAAAAIAAAASGAESAQPPTLASSEAVVNTGDQLQPAAADAPSDALQVQAAGEALQPAAAAFEAPAGTSADAAASVAPISEENATAVGQFTADSALGGEAAPVDQALGTSVVEPEAAALAVDAAASVQAEPQADQRPAQTQQPVAAVENAVTADVTEDSAMNLPAAVLPMEGAPPPQEQAPEQAAPVPEAMSASAEGPSEAS